MHPAPPHPPAPAAAPPALLVLAGAVVSLLGLTWDVQWHSDVGPDTFFTLPHLLLYSGSAISGLTSLAVVLRVTARQRAGAPPVPGLGGPPVRVIGGRFSAPVGYLLAGAGAASFLVYGLWDLWWHELYGFDAVIDSPPHVGLLLSVTTTMVGAVVVCAAAGDTGWGRRATAVAFAVLFAFGTVTVLGLSSVGDVAVQSATVLLAVLVLLVAGRLGAAVTVAAVLAAWQAFAWWFAPAVTRWYADVVGLPLRDGIEQVPELPALLPLVLLPVALLVAALRGRVPLPATGAVAGLVLGVAILLQQVLVYGLPWPDPGELVLGGVAGAVAGAVAALLADGLGTALRAASPVAVGGAR
jgi:hypothetical protein